MVDTGQVKLSALWDIVSWAVSFCRYSMHTGILHSTIKKYGSIVVWDDVSPVGGVSIYNAIIYTF